MSLAPGEYLALLAEVKANPDDDTPRLVLADWLQDHDDPRGELVALDLRRSRLPEDDPERDALWKRERQLLRRHAFDWLGPLIDLASHWTFQRGFLHLEARAERFLTDELDRIAGSNLFAWVEHLKLSEIRSPPHLDRLAYSPVLGVISCLDLSDNRIANPGRAWLLESPRLAGLREMRLRRAHLGPQAVQALADCPHLAGLLRLDLSVNHIADAGALALARSPYLARLHGLDLRGNNLTDSLAALRERFGMRVRLGPFAAGA